MEGREGRKESKERKKASKNTVKMISLSENGQKRKQARKQGRKEEKSSSSFSCHIDTETRLVGPRSRASSNLARRLVKFPSCCPTRAKTRSNPILTETKSSSKEDSLPPHQLTKSNQPWGKPSPTKVRS